MKQKSSEVTFGLIEQPQDICPHISYLLGSIVNLFDREENDDVSPEPVVAGACCGQQFCICSRLKCVSPRRSMPPSHWRTPLGSKLAATAVLLQGTIKRKGSTPTSPGRSVVWPFSGPAALKRRWWHRLTTPRTANTDAIEVGTGRATCGADGSSINTSTGIYCHFRRHHIKK